MRRRTLQLGLSFVLLTLGLTWVWLTWAGPAYERFLLAAAGPVLQKFGVSQIVESPAQLRFVSIVPFLVLMGLTPGMSLRRRSLGMLAGCALLFVAHIGLVGLEEWAHTHRRPPQRPFSTLFPAVLLADGLPFMIWAVIAQRFLGGLLTRVLSSRPGGDAAS